MLKPKIGQIRPPFRFFEGANSELLRKIIVTADNKVIVTADGKIITTKR